MPLILRKCQKDGYSRNNFYYGNTGDIVTCPDWNPEPECGNGLHGLLEGSGNWALLYGEDWLIIEANESDIVEIDDQKCKFRTGTILFRGTTEELRNSEFPARFNLNSFYAYKWGIEIGNHDIMMHKITKSYWAYKWAYTIGNHDIMINKITESEWAYFWAINIGNQDVMIDKINDSYNAYWWARNIGNQDVMKPKITDPYHINIWNMYFTNNQIMT